MMNRLRALWVLGALVVGSTACKKNIPQEVVEPKRVEVPVEASATPADPPPVVIRRSATDRAAKLGFSRYLPADTEVVLSCFHGADAIEKFNRNAATPAPRDGEVDGGSGLAKLFGDEFTLAMGPSSGACVGDLLKIYRRLQSFQAEEWVGKLAASVDSLAEGTRPTRSMSQFRVIQRLLNDSESGASLLEALRMPPVYLALKTHGDNREPLSQQVAQAIQFFAMIDSMAEPLQVERAGAEFSGYRIVGTKVAEQLKAERSQIESWMTATDLDRFISLIERKELVLLSGVVGEYVVAFVGTNVDEFKFAGDEEHSLLGGDALAACDPYLENDLCGVAYIEPRAFARIAEQSNVWLVDWLAGWRMGLAGVGAFGDTRDLEALLRLAEDREQLLLGLGGTQGGTSIAFLQDGFRLESFGGRDSGSVDWNGVNRLASLGDAEGVVMFANYTASAAHDRRMRDYIDVLVETLDAVVERANEMPSGPPQRAAFQKDCRRYRETWSRELRRWWPIIRDDWAGALGQERAWVMDLQGECPSLPAGSQELQDSVKIPRLSLIAPVVGGNPLGVLRAPVGSGLNDLLATLGGITGKPMANGPDFKPSVLVDGDWFAASTSGRQAKELLSRAQAGGKSSDGFYLSVDCKLLENWMQQSGVLLKKNPGAFGLSAQQVGWFATGAGWISGLDRVAVRVRREQGCLRSSIHCKSRQ